MPDLLLEVKLQLQVYHGGVYLRELALESASRLVQGGEDEGQLAENVGVDDGAHEHAGGRNRRLYAVLGTHVRAEQGQHGRV